MRYTLRMGVRIRAPRERVFELLLTPHHMARWFCSFAQVEPKPGGRLRFGGDYCIAEPPETGWLCTFTAGEIRRSVTFAWRMYDADTSVTWAIEDEPSGCLLRVTHEDLPRLESTCGTFQDAWRACLGNLMAIAEGRDDSLRPDSYPPREPRIVLNTLVNAPPATVFAALVEPPKLKGWAAAKGEPVVEARVEGRYGFGGEIPGTIVAIEPAKTLAVDRFHGDRPTRLAFDLEEKSGGRSGVHFEQTGFMPDDLPTILLPRGRWTERLVGLKNFVEAGDTGFAEPYEEQVSAG